MVKIYEYYCSKIWWHLCRKQRKIEKEYHSNVNERASNLPNITSPQRTLKGSLSQRNYNSLIAYPDIYKHFQ